MTFHDLFVYERNHQRLVYYAYKWLPGTVKDAANLYIEHYGMREQDPIEFYRMERSNELNHVLEELGFHADWSISSPKYFVCVRFDEPVAVIQLNTFKDDLPENAFRHLEQVNCKQVMHNSLYQGVFLNDNGDKHSYLVQMYMFGTTLSAHMAAALNLSDNNSIKVAITNASNEYAWKQFKDSTKDDYEFEETD